MARARKDCDCMTLQEKIKEAAENYFAQRDELFDVNDFSREVIAEESFKSGANFMLQMLKAEQAKVARLKEALERAINWVEVDPHNKTDTEWQDLDVARAALAELEK